MRRSGLTGSFWPSPRQEGLLRLALAPGVDVEQAWLELQPLEIETLEEGTFALLPLVHRRLEQAGVDDPRLPRLAGTVRSTWVRNQLQLERLPPLLEALAGADIEPIVVGGAAVATRYYDQLGLRPILQLELLLAREQATRAGSVLSRNGWRIDHRRPGRLSRLLDESGRVAAVLYEGPPPYASGPLGPAHVLEAVREAASERLLEGASALTLSPADELLFACAQWARRTAAPGIQWLVDVHQILASGDVDPELLATHAWAQRLTCPVGETLAYLEAITGLPGRSEELIAILDREEPTRRERLTHRLAANGLGPLGLPPESVLEHARSSLDQPLGPALRGVPGALRDAWALDRLGQVPVVAARKVFGRARRAARRQPVPRDNRSRSASS